MQVHVLRYLDGVGAPWCDHLAPWADEKAFDTVGVNNCGVAVEPGEFGKLAVGERVVGLRGDYAVLS